MYNIIYDLNLENRYLPSSIHEPCHHPLELMRWGYGLGWSHR